MVLDSFNLLPILKEIDSKHERNRRLEELRNAQIFDGLLHEYVQEKLQKLYPKTWDCYNVADYNIHRKITEKKSKSYVKPPTRMLDQETETELYNSILEKFNFNDAMKLMDLYKNRHAYCAVGVLKEFGDKYSFWTLAPYDFNVHRDENGEIHAWSFPHGADDNGETWSIWTNESYLKVKTKDFKSFAIIPIDNNPEMINPYGILPFVYVPMDMAGNYPNTMSLPRQTIELNTNLSIYLTSGNMQIGQLVLKYPKSVKIDWVVSGLMTAMKLEQEEKPDRPRTEAEYISPNPNLEGHKDSIMTYMAMILDEHGMTSSGVVKGGEKFTSGFDRLLSSADVQDIIEDNQDVYTRVENAIYNIIKQMNLNDNVFTFKSEKLKVRFARPKILSSDSEKLDNLAKKKALGLWEEWELILEIDPNMSEEEAKEKAARLKPIKEEINGNNQIGSMEGNQAKAPVIPG